METAKQRIVIACLCHRAEKPVQRLAATSAEDYDYERPVFRGRCLLNLVEHGASDRFFRRQHFVSDVADSKLREILIFDGIVGEPDVSSHHMLPNRLSSRC
jgi:hypothetical protein